MVNHITQIWKWIKEFRKKLVIQQHGKMFFVPFPSTRYLSNFMKCNNYLVIFSVWIFLNSLFVSNCNLFYRYLCENSAIATEDWQISCLSSSEDKLDWNAKYHGRWQYWIDWVEGSWLSHQYWCLSQLQTELW